MKLAVRMRVLVLCISTLLVPTLLGDSGGSGIAAATSTPESDKPTTSTPTTSTPVSTTTQASTGAGKSTTNTTITPAQTTSVTPSTPTTSEDSAQSTTDSEAAVTTVTTTAASTSTNHQTTSTVTTMTTSSTTPATTGSTSTTTPSPTNTSSNPNTNATTGSQTVTPGHTTGHGTSTSTPTTGTPASTASTRQTTANNASTTTSSKNESSTATPTTSTPTGNETSTQTPSTTLASTPPPPSTASTGATTKPTTAAPTTTATPPPLPPLLINEVNLIFNKTAVGKFVEIKGPANFSANVTVVVFSGITGLVIDKVDANVTLSSAGLYKIDLQGEVLKNETTYAVALLNNGEASNSSLPLLDRLGTDLMDSFVFSTTYAQVNSGLQEIMLPDNQNLFVIKQGLLPLGNYSISRCGGEAAGDQGAFMVTPATPGTASDCSRQPGSLVQVKLPSADCKRWLADHTLVKELLSYMVTTMNKACQCGVSRMLFTDYKITCGSVIFEAMLTAAFPTQSALVTQIFTDTVANSSQIIVGNKSYAVDACSVNTSCLILKPVIPPTTEKGGDIKVTVSVVVSCIVVFILIVIAVVLYMKRKRKGILQFRMTRLDEDDDLMVGDMDDFVGGGGGEPSFSNPLYGRRK